MRQREARPCSLEPTSSVRETAVRIRELNTEQGEEGHSGSTRGGYNLRQEVSPPKGLEPARQLWRRSIPGRGHGGRIRVPACRISVGLEEGTRAKHREQGAACSLGREPRTAAGLTVALTALCAGVFVYLSPELLKGSRDFLAF